jgi:glycosyltransferase involved in cell wall biosynthesis
MLCGTLMIAANTGGTLDIIRDKETGLLYRQGSAEDLAEKLLFAMENREKCREMAARGRDFACRELNADRNARDIKNVYEEILNKK